MFNVLDCKLGKHDAVVDPRTLKVTSYFEKILPPPPDSCDYTAGITNFGMMLNDLLGDCTVAAVGHAEQTVTATLGQEWTATDRQVRQRYSEWCGYVIGDPSTDNGGDELTIMKNWHRYSFFKHLLLSYGSFDPLNLTSVKQLINLLGGIYIGVQLPVTAQGASNWTLMLNQDPSAVAPGSWGGHAVWCPKYRTLADGSLVVTCVSWGKLIDITESFWTYVDPNLGPYIDESHGLIMRDWMTARGKTLAGFDFNQMLADSNALSRAA